MYNSFPHDDVCVFASKKLKSVVLFFPSSFFFVSYLGSCLIPLYIITEKKRRKKLSLFFLGVGSTTALQKAGWWCRRPERTKCKSSTERGGGGVGFVFVVDSSSVVRERVLRIMSFVSRLANYVLNEFLVDALANSKTFQRFAVRADDAMRKGRVLETVAETTSKAKENAEKVAEEARATAAKMMEEAAKKTPPPPKT